MYNTCIDFHFSPLFFMIMLQQQKNQGPVVQNFVSLTLLLSPKFVIYISTLNANTLLLLLKKCENPSKKCKNPLQCKGFSHFSTKNNSVFAYVVGIYLLKELRS